MLKSLDHRGAGRFLKKLGCLTRVLLLGVCLTGLALAGLWLYQPKKVIEFDDYVKAKRLKPFRKRLDKGRELLTTNIPEGRSTLELLLEDLSHVRKGDQLKRIKEDCFKALEPTYVLPEEASQLLEFYKKWRAFDDRDLRPEVGLAKTLMAIPERAEEGKAALVALNKRLPEAPLVAGAYGSLILAQGSSIEFFQHFKRQREELRKKALANNWFFYWNAGKGFQRNGRAQGTVVWTGPNEIEISCSLPEASYWAIRIDSPPWLPICLVEPEFTLTGGEKPMVALLADTTQRLNDTLVRHGMYFADQGDPYMTSKLPKVTALGKNAAVSFKAGLLPGSFEKLITLLPDAQAREGFKAELNEEDRALFSQLEPYFPSLEAP